MYELGYWFYQLFKFLSGREEFGKWMFSTYSLEIDGLYIYPLIPSISVAIAICLLLSAIKIGKAGLIKP